VRQLVGTIMMLDACGFVSVSDAFDLGTIDLRTRPTIDWPAASNCTPAAAFGQLHGAW
jgi:hypothetical protein